MNEMEPPKDKFVNCKDGDCMEFPIMLERNTVYCRDSPGAYRLIMKVLATKEWAPLGLVYHPAPKECLDGRVNCFKKCTVTR